MFKVCARCGGEYQAWVSVCPDCNTPLDLAPGETLAPAATQPSAPLADPVLLKVGEPWELRALAESLQQHGISSQIDTHPLGGSMATSRAASRGQPTQLGIYVGRADLEAVQAFAAEVAARELPDASDLREVSHDATACPACGEPTPENAAACASCGLEFPEVGAEGT